MVFSPAKAHSHSWLNLSISNKSRSSSMAHTYILIRREIALETTRAMWSAKPTRVRPTSRLIQADLTYPLYLAGSTVMKGSRTVFGATIASTSTYRAPCSDTRARRSYSGSSKTSRRHWKWGTLTTMSTVCRALLTKIATVAGSACPNWRNSGRRVRKSSILGMRCART